MKHLSTFVIGVVAVSLMGGCADEANTSSQEWQAFHASADGKGWKGPVRPSMDAAMADAEAYASENGINGEEVMVLAIPPGGKMPEQLPPNPLARRELEKPVTLESLVGYWILTDTDPEAKNVHRYLDIRSDGTCKTDFGARFATPPVDEPDRIEVLNPSSFAIALVSGPACVFAVTRFDGNTMDVLAGGYEDYSMRLERAERPANEPGDGTSQ